MKNNFNKIIDRKNTNSVKWDLVDRIFRGENLLPMWVADMDFASPEVAKDSLRTIVERGILGYSACLDDYFDSIVDWYERRHSTIINKEWIVYTSGTVNSINMFIQAFTRVGDGIIVQKPVYYPFFNSIVNNNRKVINNALVYDEGGYCIDFNHLVEVIETENPKMMILCSPHNPVGRVWTVEELELLSDICTKYDIFLISDEVHSDLVLFGNKHCPYFKIKNANFKNAAMCISPSKTFNTAGVHIANVIIPDKQKQQQFKAHLQACGLDLPNIFAVALQKSVYKKEGEAWLEKLLFYIEGNMLYMDKFLKDNLPRVKMVQPQATYLAWLDFRELNLLETEINQIMIKKAKIALDYGSMFGEEGKGFQRINIACPQTILSEALLRIKHNFENY